MWKGERFREKLARWRAAAKLSQADLDDAIGSSKGYVAQLETRDRDYDGDPVHDGRSRLTPPTRDVCAKIQTALQRGVTVERARGTKHKGGGLRLAPDEVWSAAARERLHDLDAELYGWLRRAPEESRREVAGGDLRARREHEWGVTPEDLDRAMDAPEGTWARMEAGEIPPPSQARCERIDVLRQVPTGATWNDVAYMRMIWFDYTLYVWHSEWVKTDLASEDEIDVVEGARHFGEQATRDLAAVLGLTAAGGVSTATEFTSALALLTRIPDHRLEGMWRRVAVEVGMVLEELGRRNARAEQARARLAAVLSEHEDLARKVLDAEREHIVVEQELFQAQAVYVDAQMEELTTARVLDSARVGGADLQLDDLQARAERARVRLYEARAVVNERQRQLHNLRYDLERLRRQQASHTAEVARLREDIARFEG